MSAILVIGVFDERYIGSQWYNTSFEGKLRLWSDFADAKTDLNLC